MKRKKFDILPETILGNILVNLSLVVQWANSKHFDNANDYAQQAEALVKLMEVSNCGSIGGFDSGQSQPVYLLDRFDWLLSNEDGLSLESLRAPGHTSFKPVEAYERVRSFYRGGIKPGLTL